MLDSSLYPPSSASSAHQGSAERTDDDLGPTDLVTPRGLGQFVQHLLDDEPPEARDAQLADDRFGATLPELPPLDTSESADEERTLTLPEMSELVWPRLDDEEDEEGVERTLDSEVHFILTPTTNCESDDVETEDYPDVRIDLPRLPASED